MRPTYQSLGQSVGKHVIADGTDRAPAISVMNETTPSQVQSPVQVLEHSGNLEVVSATGGWQQGAWVHYLPTKATYGVAQTGQMWAASAPFSGCHLSIGKKDGKMYIAHRAPPGTQAKTQWLAKTGNWDEWARIKIGVDKSAEVFTASIVFVDWFDGDTPDKIKISRVEFESGSGGNITTAPMAIRKVTSIPMVKSVEWK